ncbi:hypothetical protein G6F37_002799 [Rhizopus arrhizus]|nr:hypothetical protein G6F38_008600 [Rhizopus arrhizus]KAG1161750.1 hypothetical protein G6F37_002799 [Rhizopus arrhizus]
MTYKGYKELKKYIEQTPKASFTKVVEKYVVNLANWSFQESINTSPVFNGFWFEKYRQMYMEVNGNTKDLRKPKSFNLLTWNDILARINRRRKLVDRCSEAALDVTAAVAKSSTAQVTQSLKHRNLPTNDNLAESRDNEETSKEKSSDTGDSIETTYIADNEVQNSDLNNYAVKKLLGTFNENDKTTIQQKLTKGDSIEQRITNHIIELLCQDHLTPIEQETLHYYQKLKSHFVKFYNTIYM